MKLKQTILCVSLIVSSLFVSGKSFGGNSTSSSVTLWDGLITDQSLNRDSKDFLLNTMWEKLRSADAKVEHLHFASAVVRSRGEYIMMPMQADMMKYIAINTRLYFDFLFKQARTELVEIALKSPNRGPVALSSSESLGKTGGGTVPGIGIFSNSFNGSASKTETTCEENLAWKGYKVSCKTGEGTAVVDGVVVSFKRWEPIKAEGTIESINWRYQSGTLQFEDVTGNTVWFLIGPDNLSVVKVKLLTSFKRDQIAGIKDSATSDVTAEYTDLLWRDSFGDGYLALGMPGLGEWCPLFVTSDVGIKVMESFVFILTRLTQSQLDRKLDQIDKLSAEELSNLKNGHYAFDYTRKSVFENHIVTPYDPDAIFKVNKIKPTRGNAGNW